MTPTQQETALRHLARRAGKPPTLAELHRLREAEQKRVLKRRSAD